MFHPVRARAVAPPAHEECSNILSKGKPLLGRFMLITPFLNNIPMSVAVACFVELKFLNSDRGVSGSILNWYISMAIRASTFTGHDDVAFAL